MIKLAELGNFARTHILILLKEYAQKSKNLYCQIVPDIKFDDEEVFNGKEIIKIKAIIISYVQDENSRHYEIAIPEGIFVVPEIDYKTISKINPKLTNYCKNLEEIKIPDWGLRESVEDKELPRLLKNLLRFAQK